MNVSRGMRDGYPGVDGVHLFEGCVDTGVEHDVGQRECSRGVVDRQEQGGTNDASDHAEHRRMCAAHSSCGRGRG